MSMDQELRDKAVSLIQSNHPFAEEVATTAASLSQMIANNGISNSPSASFAALLQSLNEQANDDEARDSIWRSCTASLLYLLDFVIPLVPQPVFVLKIAWNNCLTCVRSFFEPFQDDSQLLALLLAVFVSLVQNCRAVASSPELSDVVAELLLLACKQMTTALDAICSLLRCPEVKVFCSSYVVQFSLARLQTKIHRTLRISVLQCLTKIGPLLPSSAWNSMFPSFVSILQSKSISVIREQCQLFLMLVKSEHATSLPTDGLVELLEMLLRLRSSQLKEITFDDPSFSQPLVLLYHLMSATFCALFKSNSSLANQRLRVLLETLSDDCTPDVMGLFLQDIIESCGVLPAAEDYLLQSLQVKNQNNWSSLIPALNSWIEKASGTTPTPETILKVLCSLRMSVSLPAAVAPLEELLSKWLRVHSAEAVFRLCGSPPVWLVRLVAKTRGTNPELKTFLVHILSHLDKLGPKLVWESLPRFCYGATDISESFSDLVPSLIQALKQEVSRPFVLRALSILLHFSSPLDQKTLGSYSRYFLPSLFNDFATLSLSDIASLFSLIRSFLEVTPSALFRTFFDQVVSHLLKCTHREALKDVQIMSRADRLLRLLSTFVPFLGSQQVAFVLQVIDPLVEVTKLQRAVYLVLEQLGVHHKNCEIISVMLRWISFPSTDNGDIARLRCVHRLLDDANTEQRSRIEELILEDVLLKGVAGKGAKKRAMANSVFCSICKNQENFPSFLSKLRRYIAPGTPPFLKAGTLSSCSNYFSICASEVSVPDSELNMWLESVLSFLSSSNSVVRKASFVFLKHILTLLSEELFQTVLPRVLSSIPRSCVSHRRLLRNLLLFFHRRVGLEKLSVLLPSHLEMPLTSLRRKLRRKHSKQVRFRRQSGMQKSLPVLEEKDDNFDLLEHHSHKFQTLEQDSLKKDDTFPEDDDGRLIVEEEENEMNVDELHDDYDEVDKKSYQHSSRRAQGARKAKGGQGSFDKYSGARYKGRKGARGDMRQGKYEPFAYVPLKRGKKRQRAAGALDNIVIAGKRGAAKGRKQPKFSRPRKKKQRVG